MPSAPFVAVSFFPFASTMCRLRSLSTFFFYLSARTANMTKRDLFRTFVIAFINIVGLSITFFLFFTL